MCLTCLIMNWTYVTIIISIKLRFQTALNTFNVLIFCFNDDHHFVVDWWPTSAVMYSAASKIWVTLAVELMLECSSNTQRQTGLLLLELHQSGVQQAEQVCKGLQEILNAAENVTADAGQWLCLCWTSQPHAARGRRLHSRDLCSVTTLLPPERANLLLAL